MTMCIFVKNRELFANTAILKFATVGMFIDMKDDQFAIFRVHSCFIGGTRSLLWACS